MTELRNKILQSVSNDNFFEVVYQLYLYEKSDREKVASILIQLHNDNLIDAITEFRKVFKSATNNDTYLINRLFEESLAELDATVEAVMECIHHLSSQSDESISSMDCAFTNYCLKDLSRTDTAVKLALDKGGDWLNFVCPALVAGSKSNLQQYTSMALDFIRSENHELRTAIVFSFSMFDYSQNQPILGVVTSELKRISSVLDDNTLAANILRIALNFKATTQENKVEIYQLVKLILLKESDDISNAAAYGFWIVQKELSENILDLLIDKLKNTRTGNYRAFDNIDRGLCQLIKSDKYDIAIEFIEYILLKHPKDFEMKVFDSFIRDIYKHPKLSFLITRWFLSRKLPLCKACLGIIGQSYGKDVELKADNILISNSYADARMLVARKAVGWFFTSPISSTSYLISLIEHADDVEIVDIEELLFNPLFISYSTKIKQYFEKIETTASPKVVKVISNINRRLDRYFDGLEPAWRLSELMPPLGNREAYIKKFDREMAESYKEAEKQSIFSQLATKTTLLYGRNSINYIYDGDGKSHRQEMQLQRIETSMEHPRLEKMDPHGVDYKLRVYRVEGGLE